MPVVRSRSVAQKCRTNIVSCPAGSVPSYCGGQRYRCEICDGANYYTDKETTPGDSCITKRRCTDKHGLTLVKNNDNTRDRTCRCLNEEGYYDKDGGSGNHPVECVDCHGEDYGVNTQSRECEHCPGRVSVAGDQKLCGSSANMLGTSHPGLNFTGSTVGGGEPATNSKANAALIGGLCGGLVCIVAFVAIIIIISRCCRKRKHETCRKHCVRFLPFLKKKVMCANGDIPVFGDHGDGSAAFTTGTTGTPPSLWFRSDGPPSTSVPVTTSGEHGQKLGSDVTGRSGSEISLDFWTDQTNPVIVANGRNHGHEERPLLNPRDRIV